VLAYVVDKEGLWYRVLQARYSEEGGRLKDGGEPVRCGGGCCVVFFVVWGLKWSWFEDNVRRVVGGGADTYFWLDNWVGEFRCECNSPTSLILL